MLMCMDTELQKRYENFTVYDMVKQLNALYLKQARTERYDNEAAVGMQDGRR